MRKIIPVIPFCFLGCASFTPPPEPPEPSRPGPIAQADDPTLDSAPDMAMSPVDLAVADTTCGGMQFDVERIQPNVMFVIDRSGSMGEPIASGVAVTKWENLKTALQSIVTAFDAQLRMGVTIYPSSSGDSCSDGDLTAVAAMNGATVLQQLAAQGSDGNTPTATTLAKVRAHGMLNDPTRENIVVLATDGLPNCSGDVEVEVAALYALSPAVKTYVIGVGANVSSQVSTLDAWATLGHTARAGSVKFYPTTSPAELTQAFTDIATGVVSCSFQLSSTAPDPAQLFVWLDGNAIVNDPTNGYDYDVVTDTVTLHGAACVDLKAKPSAKLQVVYGCPAPPPIF